MQKKKCAKQKHADSEQQSERDSTASKHAENCIAEDNTASTTETLVDGEKQSNTPSSQMHEQEDEDNMKALLAEARRVGTQKRRKYMENHGYQMKGQTPQTQSPV